MALHPIDSIAELKNYLNVAIQLEHATIPPYLTALYSIHPDTNSDALNIIRTVAVEEMLHLTLAANLLNAVGGHPNLTAEGFVPDYPTLLPNGETDFEVGLLRFSLKAVKTFLNIERPATVEVNKLFSGHHFEIAGSRRVYMKQKSLSRSLDSAKSLLPLVKTKEQEHLAFYSIGEFYDAILHGIETLVEELGKDAVFTGDICNQITPEYYYSGGGDIIVVHDLASAKAAINLISEQGEGHDGGIFDEGKELSHYYRFQQLIKGRYYHEGNEPGHPTGEKLAIDWDAVYPIKANVKVSDLPEGSEVRAGAIEFNQNYKKFLVDITAAFNGKPEILIRAVAAMFHIRDAANQLMRNPIPGKDGLNAAPTFEVDL